MCDILCSRFKILPVCSDISQAFFLDINLLWRMYISGCSGIKRVIQIVKHKVSSRSISKEEEVPLMAKIKTIV